MNNVNISNLLGYVQEKVPTVTEDQIYNYFLYGEAESLRDMSLEELADLLKEGIRYTLTDLEEWLGSLDRVSFNEVGATCRQTFIDTPNLYL